MKYLIKKITLLLMALLPIMANAHDFEVDGIYYNINGNEVTVTYKGPYSFQYSNEYSGDVEIPATVTYSGIPYSVTSIGSSAFYGCSSLTSIQIPNSVTSIGCEAFYGCTGLTNIEIPNSVVSLGSNAFSGCTGIRSIIIPPSIITIGDYVFIGCNSLESIEIPQFITSIGDYAFGWSGTPWYDNQPNGVVYAGQFVYKYKDELTRNDSCIIILKEGTLGIADHAFGSSQKNVMLPKEVPTEEIRDYYEFLKNIKSIVIPNTVKFIGNGAFRCCSNLTAIDIPNSVSTIGSYAFYGKRLQKVSIGNSVTKIDQNSFYSCTSMTDLICYASTPPECHENTFEYSYQATLHVPAASLAAYFTAPYWCNFENIVGDAVEPTGISIDEDSVEANLGEQLELTAIVTPANASSKDIIWYSTDTKVATVNNGVVTTVGFGECDIMACCFGMRAICHISVTQRITLDQQEAMLLPNHMLTLIPTALPTLPELSVTSSDPTVAAARIMSGKVQVVGINEGTVTITVGSKDGFAVPATCMVTVYTEMGDVNMDGFLNISDVTQLINYLLSHDATGIKVSNADITGDGKVAINDVTSLINILLSGH